MMTVSNVFFQSMTPQASVHLGGSPSNHNSAHRDHFLASALFLYLETLQEVIHSSWERFAESRKENEEKKNLSHRIRERRVDEESAAERVKVARQVVDFSATPLEGRFRHLYKLYPM